MKYFIKCAISIYLYYKSALGLPYENLFSKNKVSAHPIIYHALKYRKTEESKAFEYETYNEMSLDLFYDLQKRFLDLKMHRTQNVANNNFPILKQNPFK